MPLLFLNLANKNFKINKIKMVRPKVDKRKRPSSSKTRFQKKKRSKYNDYISDGGSKRLQSALYSFNGKLGKTAKRHQIPKTTLHRELKKMEQYDCIDSYMTNRNKRLVLLTEEEEASVEYYCLWQGDRGMNLTNTNVKGLIREIHSKSVQKGEKRQPINSISGPSAKFMRGFYKRHPSLSYRSSESVDRGRINNATEDVIRNYFELLKEAFVKDGIMELDEAGNPIQASIKSERVYLADETGWGVETKPKKVCWFC